MLKVLFISILVSFQGNSQNFITIRDKNFEGFLNEKYPNSMSGNQLDISSLEIVNEESLVLNSLNIENIDGIEYFVNLKSLECLENRISAISKLPSSLVKLDVGMNQLTKLPVLPGTLEELSCADNQLIELPILPNALKILYCNFNKLSSLPTLPISLEFLACGSNNLTCLPVLPESIFMGNIALNPLNCVSSHADWMDEESLKIPICESIANDKSAISCICVSTSLLSNTEISSSEIDLNDVVIFPNPTQGNVYIKAKNEISLIRVIDLKGHAVIENKLNRDINISTSITLDLSNLKNGVYFIETTLDGIISISKVIKNN
jgi:hypothetical protein